MDSGSAECVAPETVARDIPKRRQRRHDKDRRTTLQMEVSSRTRVKDRDDVLRGW